MAADNPISRAALEVVEAIFTVDRLVPHETEGGLRQVIASGDDGFL
jgi:hypothetical protein